MKYNITSIIRKGLTANLLGSVSLTLFRFVSISICTQLFGIDLYGEFIFALAIIFFFSLIIINGMDLSYIKFAHQSKSEALLFYCIKRLVVRLLVALPFIILLGIILENYFEKSDAKYFLSILAIAVVFDNISNILVALNKFKLNMIEQYYYLFSRRYVS